TPKGAPEEMSVGLRDLVTGFSRHESYFRTDGRFSIPDLPAGKFQLTASAEGGSAQVDLELREGEQKTNVAVELAALVTITGRVVEYGTTKPVAALRMMAYPALGGGGFSFSDGEDRDYITDELGRFTIKNAPSGKLAIRGMPRDWNDSDYASLSTVREVSGTGTIDLGDIPVFKKRVKQNDPVGKLGVRFAQGAPDTPPDKRVLEVSWIDPTGPAARTELKIGDVITSVDGVDVTGANNAVFGTLTRAPPGTKLLFGTKRGTTIIVVLAPP
ncbi:MAG: PDZ domain-containing protein, partial [Myxococcota bacterium]|nr:PDZ domain-containing protein [Myxococcota bacterium]